MSQTSDLDLMQRGGEATAMLGAVGEIIDDLARQAVSLMVAQYRQGAIEHDFIVGKVGEIAALQNIMVELEHRQRRGIAAAERELGKDGKA